MKKNLGILILVILAFTAYVNNTNLQKQNKQITKKEKVVELLNSIETGDTKPVEYINQNKYIQHNLAVKDGLSGLGEVLSKLPKGSAKVEVLRTFEDGNYVFTHTKYNFFGPKVGFDIFRFENGKIVEHWDNLEEISETTASGRTQFDGDVQIIDKELTDSNKQLVSNFINDVLFGKNPSKITEYISTEKYLQHNPNVKDGLNGLSEALKSLAKAGMPIKYEKTYMILGEGNFVLTVSKGIFMNKASSFYDLFRIEDGKIVEHWDTIEEIPEKSTWQNNNGKF
ncbi:nuclear transport factor 2 family protein [Arcobacter sp.]|uniref:nuclear transport factor 2 family protein n=1 Tax=Arcobacter sp. TaxID=1872629 RepID=UPI003D0CB41E